MDLAAKAAREPARPSPPPWQLTDLISVETLQSIQDTFARAFGLPTVIVDVDGVNATTITNRVTFCEDLTRTSPTGGPRCTSCDRCGMRDAAETSGPAIFKCWNGLYDCAIPIAPKGHVLGYFLCGQIVTEPPDPVSYLETAAELGVDPQAYVGALGEVAVVPYQQYEASVQSMHVLAEMIAEQAAASIDSLSMLEEARRAKEETAQLVHELDTILEALRDIGSQSDYQATLASIADNLARLIPWDSCVIYLLDEEQEELVPVLIRDPSAEKIAAHRPRKGHGILGTTALGGPGRRILDVTQDPDFEPIPGVPLEPESALVVPMTYKGTVSGVILLSRFERRTFTDHELRVLDVFSSQASVSVQLSKLAFESSQRLREERAFGRLRLAIAPRAQLESILPEAARAGAELLAAEAAVLTAPGAAGAPVSARVGLGQQEAAALLAELEPAVRRANETGEAEVVERGSGSALVMPLGTSASALFTRREGAHWDRRLVGELRAQVSLGIEKTRMEERERRLLLQYQRLSELGTGLVTAGDDGEVRSLLLARTPEILGADAAFIALIDQGPDAIAVELRQRSHTEDLTLRLDGGARLATLRLRDEPAPDRSVFDTWSAEVFAAVAPQAGPGAWLAEPLPVPGGAIGGLFVVWHSATEASAEQSRILRVLASSGGSALGRFAASMATDSTLRDRVLELEALTGLAQRVSARTSEEEIASELLAALRRVGRLEGVAYGVAADAGVEILHASGLDDDQLPALVAALAGLDERSASSRAPFGDGGAELLAIPMPAADGRDRLLAGVGPPPEDDQRDRVMATLARYGSMVLENAHLHARQREAIARLEGQQLETAQQYDQLERVLSVHDTLAQAVLDGQGLRSMVRRLSWFLDAEMVVLAPELGALARWPEAAEIGWRPDPVRPRLAQTIVTEVDGASILAAPATIDGDVLAWVIARRGQPAGDVERAAVEYGAMLVALELLRERTAAEVETRLRGGLMEELFADGLVEDVVRKRVLAFGYDLARPSRVLLVEAAPQGAEPDAFYQAVADCARDWSRNSLVALQRGAVAVVAPEAPDGDSSEERRLEDELRAATAAKLPDAPLNIAVGTLCEAVADYRDSYLAARRGLDLLRLLGRAGELFSFRGSTLGSVLLQATRPDVVVKFISRYVEPLDRYDAEHTSELRRTLEVYYDAGSLEEASRRLHVHVSTLRYRLGKAAQLLDVDVRDRSAALDVQVALKAARVLAVHRD
jgi:ligand-binding sensor protein/sugar diacid utilization regulator